MFYYWAVILQMLIQEEVPACVEDNYENDTLLCISFAPVTSTARNFITCHTM